MTTIFIKNSEEICNVIEKFYLFSKASGLRLNLKKCELMAIQNCPQKEMHTIPIKTTVKYLSSHISKDGNLNEKNECLEQIG